MSKLKSGIKSKSKKWSKDVTKGSNAMDLEPGIFTLEDPRKIALSLKKSVLVSKRLKSTPFKSAMSMLNFYINRAGSNLSPKRLKILNKSKDYLRILFK